MHYATINLLTEFTYWKQSLSAAWSWADAGWQ